jgi:O-antigen ligase
MSLIRINSVLICLLPISLVLSRFVADLSICICGILFLISAVKKKEWFYFNNKFFYLFLLFFFYIFVRSLLTLSTTSIATTIFYFRFGLFSLAVWHVINNNSKFLKYFFITGIMTFLVLSLDAIYQYYNGFNIIGYPKHIYNKVGSFFGKTYILGSYTLKIFPIILGVFLYKNYSFFKNKYIYVAIILIFVLSSFSVILSGERAAFFLFFVYFFIILILLKLKKIYKIIILSSLLIFAICIFFYDSKIHQRYITQVYDQFTLDKQYKEKGLQSNHNRSYFTFSVHHETHYQVAYKMFINNIFFGQGPKMFRILCNDDKFRFQYKYETPDSSEVFDGCTTHPHNSYIQLFAETGLFGAAFLILFFCYVVLKIFYNFFSTNKISNNIYNYKMCLLLCFFINFFPIAPNGNFFNNWLSIMYYLPLGFYLQITKGKF